MKLRQMTLLKRWHVLHRERLPMEYRVWDTVLTLWVLGWVGVPPALLVHATWALPCCALLYCAPELYVRLRRHLHRRGRLRCEWLPVLAADG